MSGFGTSGPPTGREGSLQGHPPGRPQGGPPPAGSLVPAWPPLPEAAPARSRRPRVAVALVALLVLVAGALAYVLTRPDAVALAMGLEQGRTYRYGLSMSIDGTLEAGEQQVPLRTDAEGTMSWDVLSVDDQGVATVAMRLEDFTVTVNGVVSPEVALPEAQMRIAPDGRILEGGGLTLSSEAGPGTGLPGTDQFTPLLPDHPVRPGDTWSKDFDQAVPFFDRPIHYSTHNTFLRYEEVGGVDAAVIRSQVAVPLDFTLDFRRLLEFFDQGDAGIPAGSDPRFVYGGNMDADVTNWFDPDTGEVLRSRGEVAFDMTVRIEGFPEAEASGVDSIRMVGTMDMVFERLS